MSNNDSASEYDYSEGIGGGSGAGDWEQHGFGGAQGYGSGNQTQGSSNYVDNSMSPSKSGSGAAGKKSECMVLVKDDDVGLFVRTDAFSTIPTLIPLPLVAVHSLRPYQKTSRTSRAASSA